MKKNKIIVFLIIVLIICVLGLSGYMIWNKQLKNNIDNNTNNDWKDFSCDEVINEKCIIYKDNYTEISLRDSSNPKIQFNDNEISGIDYNLDFGIEVSRIDNDVIIVHIPNIENWNEYILDNNGNKLLDLENINKIKNGIGKINYDTTTKKLLLINTASPYGYTNLKTIIENSCILEKNIEDIIYSEIEIEYLGNKKFSTPKVIKENTLMSAINDVYNKDITCDEILNQN